MTEIFLVRDFSKFLRVTDKLKNNTDYFIGILTFKTNDFLFYFNRYDCSILKYRQLKNTRFKKLLFFIINITNTVA